MYDFHLHFIATENSWMWISVAEHVLWQYFAEEFLFSHLRLLLASAIFYNKTLHPVYYVVSNLAYTKGWISSKARIIPEMTHVREKEDTFHCQHEYMYMQCIQLSRFKSIFLIKDQDVNLKKILGWFLNINCMNSYDCVCCGIIKCLTSSFIL